MLEAKNVVKTFDGFRALDGVSMTVPQGAVYGLVGPNGAGKSTIIRAYSQLETEGYVYTVSGRGTFVYEVREQNRQRRAEVTARVQPLMEELRDLGMTREEWTGLWKGGNSDA